jgi:hypothetical protein
MKYPMLFLLAVVCGCHSTPKNPQPRVLEPRHAQRVKLVMYSTSYATNRTGTVEFFDVTRKLEQPCKDIALLTCEGLPHEEAEMTEAIIYRAKLMGANAVVMLEPSRSGWGDRRVFRAKAVVWTP